MNLPTFQTTLLLIVLLTVGIAAQTKADDLDFAKLNSQLSRLYSEEKYDEALVTSDRILEFIKKNHPEAELLYAAALKNRGFIETAKGDTKQGGETLRDAAKIYKKQPDLSKADGASFAGVLEAIAEIKMVRSTIAGEDDLELALRWREKSSGPEAPETGATLARLANIKFWNRNYKAAAEMYRRSLMISARVTKDLADDGLAIIRERTRCSFRKAKMEEDIASVEAEYKAIVDTLPVSTRREKRINGGVVNGKATYLAKPAYPDEAKRNRASGTVEVELLINEKGDVISACALSGNKYLIQASELSALESKFSPTLLGGQPVKVRGTLIYNFVP